MQINSTVPVCSNGLMQERLVIHNRALHEMAMQGRAIQERVLQERAIMHERNKNLSSARV